MTRDSLIKCIFYVIRDMGLVLSSSYSLALCMFIEKVLRVCSPERARVKLEGNRRDSRFRTGSPVTLAIPSGRNEQGSGLRPSGRGARGAANSAPSRSRPGLLLAAEERGNDLAVRNALNSIARSDRKGENRSAPGTRFADFHSYRHASGRVACVEAVLVVASVLTCAPRE